MTVIGETTNLYKEIQTVVHSKIKKKLNLDSDYIAEWNVSENNKVEVEFRKKAIIFIEVLNTLRKFKEVKPIFVERCIFWR
ncbi:MAG: hypothetical protein LBC39_01990 [Methanobrevibacter sp.]|nr:hypothetical protein [Candidatus Methanovirga aequatorialis]